MFISENVFCNKKILQTKERIFSHKVDWGGFAKPHGISFQVPPIDICTQCSMSSKLLGSKVDQLV